MSTNEQQPDNWSRLNIAMHWLVVVLVVFQLFNKDSMATYFRSLQGDDTATAGDARMAWLHMTSGAIILVANLLRIWDRHSRGRPPYPPETPAWSVLLAKTVHFLLFALLLAMPLLGLTAWLTESYAVGNIHRFLLLPLLGLALLHAAGALVEHFYFRTEVLRRMLGGRGRSASSLAEDRTP